MKNYADRGQQENMIALGQCIFCTVGLIALSFTLDIIVNPTSSSLLSKPISSESFQKTKTATATTKEKPSKEAIDRFKHALATIPSSYKTSQLEAQILWAKESSRRSNMSITNFAPKSLPLSKKLTNDPAFQRKLSTAYCPFQVLGILAHEKRIPLKELQNDPETCVELAMHKWLRSKEKCLKSAPELSTNHLGLLHCAASKYNGAGKEAENYADDYIKRYLQAKQTQFEKTITAKNNSRIQIQGRNVRGKIKNTESNEIAEYLTRNSHRG